MAMPMIAAPKRPLYDKIDELINVSRSQFDVLFEIANRLHPKIINLPLGASLGRVNPGAVVGDTISFPFVGDSFQYTYAGTALKGTDPSQAYTVVFSKEPPSIAEAEAVSKAPPDATPTPGCSVQEQKPKD